MPELAVKQESLPKRCEICHQSDLFDPQENHCLRCANVRHFDDNKSMQFKEKQLGVVLGASCGMLVGAFLVTLFLAYGGWHYITLFGVAVGAGLGLIIGAITGLLGKAISTKLKWKIHKAIIWGACGAFIGAIFFIIWSESSSMAILYAFEGIIFGAMIGGISGAIAQAHNQKLVD